MPQEVFKAEVLSTAKQIANFEDENLLRFAVSTICDRISLFLNLPEDGNFDRRLVNIAAQITCGGFAKFESLKQKSTEQTISSLSDNGQSISYHSAVKSFFVSAKDNEVFDGFAEILKPYRRLNVVS